MPLPGGVNARPARTFGSANVEPAGRGFGLFSSAAAAAVALPLRLC